MQIPYDEILTFSEVFAAGTAAAIVPIKSISMPSRNDKFVYRDGSDEIGPICSRLLTTLKGIQQGKIKDTFGWLDTVPPAKGYLHRGQANGQNGTHLGETVDELP